MPAQVTNYQCPSCGGPLHFAGATGRLECDYCGKSYTANEIEALYAQHDQSAAEAAQAQQEQPVEFAPTSPKDEVWDEASQQWNTAGEHLRAYNCPSCGAELICDETTAATSCPYCGNPTIVPGQLTGMLKPDYVIPFKLDRKYAIEALKKHYQGKKLLPRAFSDSNHIEEIQGVYVPFWLYSGQADADMTFDATRVHVHRRGNEEITETEHFQVRRAGTLSFEQIPVDASSKMPDAHMDAIEPFDYSELKPFSTGYLPGYLANKYDVSLEECASRADERATNTVVDAVRDTVVGYDSAIPVARHVYLRRGTAHYALFPVWMLSTRWNGKNFLFAMNGQTGKLIGDLPVSRAKYWAWFAGIFGGLAAATAAVLWLLL